MTDAVVVYGSSWCGFTQRLLYQLEELGVAFRYVDIDENPDTEKRIADWNNGQVVRPTLDLHGDIFFNPAPASLLHELASRGLLG